MKNDAKKRQENGSNLVLAIDPGLKGAIVLLGERGFKFWTMPLTEQNEVDFGLLCKIIRPFPDVHIFLERAVSFGQGTKGAFNYGKAFATIEIATRIYDQNPVTYVEPGKWTKEMHAGISKDLKAKVKSLIAAQRLFAKQFGEIPVTPKSKQKHDGIVDALLIAAYGRRVLFKGLEKERAPLRAPKNKTTEKDFY